jgi:hypothetical protein
VGSLSEELLRINHTGRAANPVAVTDALEDVFTIALGRRPHAGVEARRLVVARRLSLDAWDSALHNDADADADANADAGGHANGHAGAVHRGLARTA